MAVLVKNQPFDIIPKIETAERIEELENTTDNIFHHTNFVTRPDFTRWRPILHLLAPHGWLNDPCGPGYDPSTGKYHLAFQWNPNGNDWGDISWGHATSYDMIKWETSSKPCLSPSTWYDCRGIFTGCFQPSNMNGEVDGTLMYVYTSANHLPIHYTQPYVNGSESLSIAVSCDGGKTWKKKSCNPILPGPSQGCKVTGWRDPFLVSSWPSTPEGIRRIHRGENVLYGFISGGLVDHTPTVFVYTVQKNDLTDWKYVGILLDTGLNFRPSRWSGDFGVNWEVANLVMLTNDEGISRDFVIMGTEGCLPRDNQSPQDNNGPTARDNRIHRSQLWMCIKSNESTSSAALMQYSFGGIFDSGLYYAANSFWDPISKQQVVFGWITEEDLPDTLRHRQGWSGLISLPRVLKLKTMHRVVRARSTADLGLISSIEVTPDDYGTYTVRTLGIGPDRRLEKLRDRALEKTICDRRLRSLDDFSCGRNLLNFVSLNTLQWELDVEIEVSNNCGRVGLVIGDPEYSNKTVLFWDPISESFIIERPSLHVNLDDNTNTKINQGREVSPHTLFTYTTESRENHDNLVNKSTEVEESLYIRAIFDVSVLEVFVNERTVLSTRIYHTSNSEEPHPKDAGYFGMYFFADKSDDGCKGDDDEHSPARLVRATVWDGLSLH
ncbi:Glycosyl hydrolases family 32 superfamily [Talaromyces stipitatus ATCC 10500]|uniref:Glycosyl hydrolases family 32 superfamily n=1 Tax=Talaromyces stipitatus (strain ATCC 10500 / CBS 375.48 / QM 6759 / NRRL 1006) TaxID=441959 RepID=B8MA01_TALSN|nr:Glycosyl hydrolases family 32 superfamily [Talaromyces stipitatus ATCC 10500]EED18153.1 Glycosyl hydrolases family 32 superfamily [Talaromyces stipitatus ATCC 10500]